MFLFFSFLCYYFLCARLIQGSERQNKMSQPRALPWLYSFSLVPLCFFQNEMLPGGYDVKKRDLTLLFSIEMVFYTQRTTFVYRFKSTSVRHDFAVTGVEKYD
jgi:hypothetical protein